MPHKGRIALAAVAVLAAAALADLQWGPHARLGPGRRLPAVSEYAGKVVLIEFFASW